MMNSSSGKKIGFELNNIPIGIIEDIISRLPAETVLECKLVCRNWLTIIRHHLFPEKHLQYQLLQSHHFYNHKYYPCTTHGKNNEVKTTKIGFIAGIFDGEDEYTMFYKEFNDRLITVTKINHQNLAMAGDDLITSCNGLICIAKYIFGNPVLYVCNPMTRECVHLPEFASSEPAANYNQVSGFGYDATNKEYKAVRILYREVENYYECPGLVQVYTLGSGSGWRDKDTIAYWLRDYGVLVDGALHWLGEKRQVWEFDLADEKFSLLTELPFGRDGVDSRHRHRNLVVLGGWLSVVDMYPNAVDIWSFKKIEKRQELKSWSKEFSIERDYDDYFPLLGLTNTGELLCLKKDTNICLYSEDSELIGEFDETPTPIFFGILHVNSFISLRALGEKDVEVIESAKRREENYEANSEDELDAS